MQNLFIALALLLVGVVGCSDEPSAPLTDGSTLIIQPDTLKLLAADSSKTLDLVLSCGCNFTVAVTSMMGDTNVINCDPIDNLGEKRTMHSLRFSYSPSQAPSGGTSLTVNFLATKSAYTYTNKAVILVQ